MAVIPFPSPRQAPPAAPGYDAATELARVTAEGADRRARLRASRERALAAVEGLSGTDRQQALLRGTRPRPR